MSNRYRVRTLVLCLLMGSAGVFQGLSAQEVSFSGGKGHWYWNGPIAATDFNHGISLNVLFLPQTDCDDAMFVLEGNDQISWMKFTIDGQSYNGVAVEREYLDDGKPVVGFVLSDAAVYDLKHGYRLIINTNAGHHPRP